jgi:hypothetical protein
MAEDPTVSLPFLGATRHSAPTTPDRRAHGVHPARRATPAGAPATDFRRAEVPTHPAPHEREGVSNGASGPSGHADSVERAGRWREPGEPAAVR